jgi:hypothetical protein
MVAQACNPHYLAGGDEEDSDSRLVQTKKFVRSPSQPKAGHSGACLSSPTMAGSVK